jgi:hypothetical protein
MGRGLDSEEIQLRIVLFLKKNQKHRLCVLSYTCAKS